MSHFESYKNVDQSCLQMQYESTEQKNRMSYHDAEHRIKVVIGHYNENNKNRNQGLGEG
jgi:hypothetical protein